MTELKRVLGFKVILLITINSIMGTGIYFLPALGASIAGPASILSWILVSIVAMLTAMCFAELVSMFPKAGGVYEFAKQAFGKFTSFLVGWTAWLIGNITTAMLIVGAIQYLIPYADKIILVSISIVFVLIFNFMAFRGMKTSAVTLITFAIINLILLLSLIISGFFNFQPGNFSPFFVFPFSAVFLTVFFISETFFGWETTTFLAEETKDAERVIPKVLVIATGIIALISILLVISSLGAIPWKIFGGSTAPLADLANSMFGGTGMYIVTLGTYLVIIGAAAGWIVSSPRLLLALARDKLFITQLSDVHPKYNTPYKAIIFQTIVTSIFIVLASGSYNLLLTLLLPMVFLIYSAVILSLLVLRFKRPEIKRYFKVPFGKAVASLIIIVNIILIGVWFFTEKNALNFVKIGFSFLLVGIPIYFLLKMYHDPDSIVKVNDSFAYLTLLSENFILPKSVRKEILALLGQIKDKTVLEFGCSVGTLTLDLAKKVKPRGIIYATDISRKEVKITHNRLKKKGHEHVIVIPDEHQMNRVHPDIPKVDAIVSMGMMGYLQDVKKVLKEMWELLPYGGKIVFVDYADFFRIIPNVEWLSKDEVIEKVFRKSGFSVYVTRKKGLFWNYIYVHGIKFRKDVPYVK
ncbi:MAG TPA: amino acid permease [Candidatus Woesearchaeota archaeon]|jgi:amino acid transporter/precorrin-6B methylase 2|nr:amino acid permease [Candidatus Woesearchaeota archaeon]HJN56841.1 amino acid permease [Candidatus Woesearchaeota archaeon]|tara:strand:- start:8920 stop:10827 length:1908 start_codon:yes stop_codon:yes gene_type:complete